MDTDAPAAAPVADFAQTYAPPPASGPPVSAPPVWSSPVSGGPSLYPGGQYGGQYGGQHGSQYGSQPAQPRPQGTVYGRPAPARSHQLPASPLEHSGSLTGHILSQGTDEPPPKARTTRVVVIMTVVLSLVVITGLVIAVFARNALVNILTGG